MIFGGNETVYGGWLGGLASHVAEILSVDKETEQYKLKLTGLVVVTKDQSYRVLLSRDLEKLLLQRSQEDCAQLAGNGYKVEVYILSPFDEINSRFEILSQVPYLEFLKRHGISESDQDDEACPGLVLA